MKDYLQLDGLVFKLVPIKTIKSKEERDIDMGQMDSEKMYDIIMKWEWGNGDLTSIYHDPETRKNSISYRTNMARLMEQLINEDKKDKAKTIIDLAMKKMPLDYYGYYTMVEPFAGGYYAIGEKEKAREILTRLIKKYTENLKSYNNFTPSDQNNIAIDIVTDIERYRSLLHVMKDRGDISLYKSSRVTFNSYNKMFERFKRDME